MRTSLRRTGGLIPNRYLWHFITRGMRWVWRNGYSDGRYLPFTSLWGYAARGRETSFLWHIGCGRGTRWFMERAHDIPSGCARLQKCEAFQLSIRSKMELARMSLSS